MHVLIPSSVDYAFLLIAVTAVERLFHTGNGKSLNLNGFLDLACPAAVLANIAVASDSFDKHLHCIQGSAATQTSTSWAVR